MQRDWKELGTTIYNLEQLKEAADRNWIVASRDSGGIVREIVTAESLMGQSGEMLIRIFRHGLYRYRTKEERQYAQSQRDEKQAEGPEEKGG